LYVVVVVVAAAALLRLSLTLSDYIPPHLITAVVTTLVMIGCFALLPISEKYTRLDIDEHVSDVEATSEPRTDSQRES
jgi:hypothetical protein